MGLTELRRRAASCFTAPNLDPVKTTGNLGLFQGLNCETAQLQNNSRSIFRIKKKNQTNPKPKILQIFLKIQTSSWLKLSLSWPKLFWCCISATAFLVSLLFESESLWEQLIPSLKVAVQFLYGIHLRAGLNDPYGSLSNQNILCWFFLLCRF